jgi:Mg-chelatase subunit ChlD
MGHRAVLVVGPAIAVGVLALAGNLPGRLHGHHPGPLGDAAALVPAAPAAAALQDTQPICAPENPGLATSLFVRGTSFGNEPAVISFRDSPDNTSVRPLASVRQVGAVYGLAYDARSAVLFAGAFFKRNSPFGPLGNGGLYAIDLQNGNVSRLGRVPSAGNDMHDRQNDYQPDDRGRAYAGKSALGDLELSEDGRELLVVNLADRRIHRVSVADGSEVGAFANGAAAEPWRDDARPFALAVRAGWVFHSVTRTAQASQDQEDLAVYVYASRIDGSEMRRVAEIPLTYDRGRHRRWGPWPRKDDDDWLTVEHPQPLAADIAFDFSGAMILGIRDRFIDTGPSIVQMYRVAPGDILRLAPAGDMTWALDVSAPEYYTGDDLTGWHDEIAIGALAVLPERDVVVVTAIDPLRTYHEGARLVGSISAGALWLDNSSGGDMAREELMFNSLRHAGPFGKANGLGDVEVLCVGPTATTTSVPPTDTPTPTPTATATATANATASSTATATGTATPMAVPYTIYLPLAHRQRACKATARYADVAVILDRSTSMMRPAAEGSVPKNQASIAAARTLVGMLRLDAVSGAGSDRVAIVGFNDVAWIEGPLTGSRSQALHALDRLEAKTAEGTRLDLALDEGQRSLASAVRLDGIQPVMVLLTDGLPNRVPTPIAGGLQEDTVLAHARAIKALGTRIHTIGVGQGEDVLRPLLERVASSPEAFHYAPTGDELEAIYREIAVSIIRCPGEG